jgi:hypothetical protein
MTLVDIADAIPRMQLHDVPLRRADQPTPAPLTTETPAEHLSRVDEPQATHPTSPAIGVATDVNLPAPPATLDPREDVSGAGSEPFVPASLSGEPIIPLADEDTEVPGSITLKLVIDENGHVTDSEVVTRHGLSNKAVAVFQRAFSGYEYMPARRGGRTVRSEVALVVGVREGERSVDTGPP